jgi:hypothetical protein
MRLRGEDAATDSPEKERMAVAHRGKAYVDDMVSSSA